jgi:hypothetical protein
VIRPLPIRFVVGLLAGFAGALLLGEIITRLCLPEDLLPFLGEASPLTGVYRPDSEIGVDYRSVEGFRAQYRERLRELEEPNRPQETWAWFGNSFVQAPQMLGDTAQIDRPDVRMFYLRRNSQLPLFVAQLRLLLDSGLKPDRVILVLVPVDVLPLAKHPLHTIGVNSRGAIIYRWRPPQAPFNALLRSSRLALLAWVRSGRHTANPSFRPRLVTEEVPASVKQDLDTIFRVVGDVSRKHRVPVTVLLLPNREQIFGKAGHALQDYECECCRAKGIDCFDARDLFVNGSDKLSLFLPDWHFTDKGNRILLQGLYRHWQEQAPGKAQP